MNKIFTIYAGVNGAGKSSLYNFEKPNHESVRINVDEKLVENNGDWKNSIHQIKAARDCKVLEKECFAKDVSFNRETTFSSREILKTIDFALDNGYEIDLNFICVDNVEIAKKRVAKRVLNGGHGISDDLIEKRYQKSLENLRDIISSHKCRKINIYDNTIQIKLVAKIENGKILNFEKVKWLEEAQMYKQKT